MKTRELNEAVAKAMGWGLLDYRDFPHEYLLPCGKQIPARGFNPATSLDSFREHVIPVLHECGLLPKFGAKVIDLLKLQPHSSGYLNGYHAAALLSADPAILCEAALAVMGGE